MASVVLSHKDMIIGRLTLGEYASEIAQSLGITPQALSKSLAVDPAYQAAKMAGIEHRLALREAELEQAQDAIGLGRARELLSHQRWRAEHEHAVYMKREQAAASITVIVQRDADTVTIEHDSIVTPIPHP